MRNSQQDRERRINRGQGFCPPHPRPFSVDGKGPWCARARSRLFRWSVLSAALTAPAMAWAQFIVRTADVSLVPPEALPLGGYTERKGALFEPGGERLIARAVVLEQGSTKIALVAAEMLTIPESLAREVRRRLPPGVRLMLIATHTHCAPDSQMLNERMTFAIPGIATYRRRWLTWYAQKIAGAVQIALDSYETQGHHPWRSARPELERIALDHNRARRAGGRPDPDLYLLTDPWNSWLAVYAAHPTLHDAGELHLRGDWPGATMRLGLTGIVVTGPIGDVSPTAPGETAETRVANLARDVFRAATLGDLKNQEGARDPVARRTPAAGALRWSAAEIAVGKPVPHPEFAKANKIPESLAQSLVERFAPASAQVSVVAVGKVAMIGIPGEPTAALGRRLQAAARDAGFADSVVISHVNGWLGYILEADDYARGGYEARLAFHGPGLADRVVRAARAALRGAKG